MPKVARLRGYKPLGNSKREYRTPSGKVISRYEYDTRRLRKAGWKNRYQFEQARKSQAWEGVKKWQDRLSGGEPTPSAFQMALDPIYADAYAVERRRRQLPRDEFGHVIVPELDYELTDPDGPMAHLLVALGQRDIADRWNVGDTPKGETR